MAETAAKTSKVEKKAKDVVETIEEVVQTGLLARALNNRVINSRSRLPIAVGVVGTLGGAAIGYFLGRKSIEHGFYEESGQLAFNLDNGFVDVSQVGGGIIVEEEAYTALDKGEAFVKDMLGHKAEPAETVILEQVVEVQDDEVEPIRRNVFAQTGDGWDLEAEIESRKLGGPYVIHHDEYHANETEYAQTALTFYAEDGIMVDEDMVPVYSHEQVVGPLRWGHGSLDPDVFFVRNDKARAEYEISRHPGAYSVEVLGLEIEPNERNGDMKHSATRFRDRD